MVIALTNEEAWTLKQIDRNVDAIIRWIEKVDRLIPILMEQKSLAEKQATSEWISVKDRLPEKYKLVLCYKDGKTRIGYYIGAEYVKGVAAFADYSHTRSFGVTHWMPLPEPPEVEV